jgi:hypothetical protein
MTTTTFSFPDHASAARMRQMPETLELLFFFMTEVTRDSEIRHLVADKKKGGEDRDLDVAVEVDQDIVRFDISVGDVVGVKVGDGTHEISEEGG